MPGSDRSVDLLRLLKPLADAPGLKIVNVYTTDPFPLTFIFEGTKMALDAPLFEIPVDFYPLKKGDRLLAYPMVGKGASQRWGLIQKLNGGLVFATMQSVNSLTIDGIAHTYTSDVLILPPALTLIAGNRVSLIPTWATDKIKYVVTQKY